MSDTELNLWLLILLQTWDGVTLSAHFTDEGNEAQEMKSTHPNYSAKPQFGPRQNKSAQHSEFIVSSK